METLEQDLRKEHEVRALDGVSVSIQAGEFVAIVAPNGVICLLDTHCSGQIFLNDLSSPEEPIASRQSQRGRAHQLLSAVGLRFGIAIAENQLTGGGNLRGAWPDAEE